MPLMCLASGCVLHNGTQQREVEGVAVAQSPAECSAKVQRLPPVSGSLDAPSLAATDSPTAGARLKLLAPPEARSEAARRTPPQVSSEMPGQKDVGNNRRDSPAVPAVFWQEPGLAARPSLPAQTIPTEWRQWPGSVTKVSHQVPPSESGVTDVFDRREEAPLQVQFGAGDPPAAQPANPEPLPKPKPEPNRPTPVRLRCDDVEVRKALEMLSNEASVSILVAPGVTGKVTANLQGLSFDEALGAILKLCNLAVRRQNDLIFVYPLADVPQLSRSLRAFPLDYAAVADAMPGVQGLLSPSGKAFQIQSSSSDNRKMQNVIVVEDLPDYLGRIEQYLAEIDRPPRQVLIEVHVLEITLDEENKHGVNFRQTINILNNVAHLELHGLANPLASQAFFVNVDGANLEALIECLKTTTDAKTLASPRVLVLNGQQARIQIGQQLGYRVITTTETSSMQDVKFLDLGVVLTVAPYISRDNQVVMHIKPQVSSGEVNSETGLPDEETTEVQTDVLLRDGQGMVIGGLIKEKDSNVQSKIPLLGDIWLIGRLFQHRELVKSRSEIVIALVPRVLPFPPEYEAQDQVDTARAAAPLFQGPLCRCPRPWEPCLPDTDCRLRDFRCRGLCR
jgi:type IV pilus assembly protein PilQ